MKSYTLAARSVKENFRTAASKTAFACLFARSAHDVSRARKGVAPHSGTDHAGLREDRADERAAAVHGDARSLFPPSSERHVVALRSYPVGLFDENIHQRLSGMCSPENIRKPEKNRTLRDALGNGSERNRLPIVGHPPRSMATTNGAGRARAPQTMTDPSASRSRRGAA